MKKKDQQLNQRILEFVQSKDDYFCAVGLVYGYWEPLENGVFGIFNLLNVNQDPIKIPCHAFKSVARYSDPETPKWYQVYPSIFKDGVRLSLVSVVKSVRNKHDNNCFRIRGIIAPSEKDKKRIKICLVHKNGQKQLELKTLVASCNVIPKTLGFWQIQAQLNEALALEIIDGSPIFNVPVFNKPKKNDKSKHIGTNA